MRGVSKRVRKCLHFGDLVAEVDKLHDFVLDERDISWVVDLQVLYKVLVLIFVQNDLVLL